MRTFCATTLSVLTLTLALATAAFVQDRNCQCGISQGYHHEEGTNDVLLGCNAPAYVVFKDGQMPDNCVAIWKPAGSTMTWSAIHAAVSAQPDKPDWWSRIDHYMFFNDLLVSGNRSYRVEKKEGWWHASKSGDTISNTIWFAEKCTCSTEITVPPSHVAISGK